MLWQLLVRRRRRKGRARECEIIIATIRIGGSQLLLLTVCRCSSMITFATFLPRMLCETPGDPTIKLCRGQLFYWTPPSPPDKCCCYFSVKQDSPTCCFLTPHLELCEQTIRTRLSYFICHFSNRPHLLFQLISAHISAH